VLANEERISGDAGLMLNVLRKTGAEVRFIQDEKTLAEEFERCSPLLLIDALLGTGLSSEVTGLYARAIKLINHDPAQVVAVDIPSGVSGSDGRVLGDAVKADLTLCFDSAKIGHGSRPGADYVGELRRLDIGIPQAGRPGADFECCLIEPPEAAGLLPQRSPTGHKGSFGHLGVVAGSRGMTGAAVLCSEAGLRSGAGLVTLVCPGSLQAVVASQLTEVMTRALEGDWDYLVGENCSSISAFADSWQALIVGPGLGQNGQTVEAVRQLVRDCSCPLVLDADGLNALTGALELLQKRTGPPILLTPHPGEFSRLTGKSVAEIEADRFRLARQFSREHRVVLLLKGARTLIADPTGRVWINSSGNVALATAGSGDLLSGLIGGLLAQGLSSFAAASLGAWLHGAAADLLADEKGWAGILAGELARYVPAARHQLEGAHIC
jgi:NAD(P)H-hydrate epimerase